MTPRVTGSVPTGTTITPEEYVEFCLDRSRGHDFNGLELRVAGTIDLTKIRGGRELFTLRKAVVDGDVFADETCALSVIEDCVIEGGCKVDKSKLSHVRRKFHAKGDFSATECTNLRFLGGQYDGGVNLEGACIGRLEKGMSCKGNLRLTRCRVQRLNCQVSGNVSISHSGVREFGPDFRVGGDLWISDCSNLHKLGYVGTPNNVNIFGFGVKRISRDFVCKGRLRIRSNHSIENISPEIKIGGLRLVDAGLEELDLPNIDGDVQIDKCEDLRRIKIGGRGQVELRRCMVDNIDRVGNEAKSVRFENCQLVREVGGVWRGDVVFDDMRLLENIQPSFECGGNFRACSCHSLRKIGGNVKGDALVSCCDNLKNLGGDFSASGNLHVAGCGLENLSLGCHVGADLKVFATAVSSTTDTMRVGGNADLREAKHLKYMRGFVGGNLNVDGSSIVSLEDDLEVGGDISAEGCHCLGKIDCAAGGQIRATGKRIHRATGKAAAKRAGREPSQRLGGRTLPKDNTPASGRQVEKRGEVAREAQTQNR